MNQDFIDLLRAFADAEVRRPKDLGDTEGIDLTGLD